MLVYISTLEAEINQRLGGPVRCLAYSIAEGGRRGHDLESNGNCKGIAVSPGQAGAAQLRATVNSLAEEYSIFFVCAQIAETKAKIICFFYHSWKPCYLIVFRRVRFLYSACSG
jgi:hypothetical protein